MKNFLLEAINDFRHWNAEPGTSWWDTLMHYFQEDAEEYAVQKLVDKWFSDEAIQDLWGEALFVNYEAMFFDLYFGREDGIIDRWC